MQCFVYKSLRKGETYVYLRAADGFEVLPPAMAEQLGNLTFVIEIELSPTRKLARENVEEVMTNLIGQGYHLQFPPPAQVEASD
ncbi:MAG TPA: YcgL domain-containing protein [Dokdonella sp.]|uniref:YcgL domain-containing protein n=1 Tax=Dokdonella sp. TaxID=2291710 RepID=UPI002D7F38AE|nr:YcgL domain-containing protein [Dokdonella sp.]HET9032903.1 YcgL domain-containing protein [Dokdonella sp.]